MLIVENVSRTFGAHEVLNEVSWQIPSKKVVGLVGPNGAGKTTLLKILAGQDEPDGGQVIRPKDVVVGFLPQEIALTERSGTLLDTILKGRQDLIDLEEKMMSLESRLIADQSISAEYANIQEEFRSKGGWEFRSRAREIAVGMGFKSDQFDNPITSFSGGWQMRALLARLLFRHPDVLLLDEPTNHLDLQCVEWLERFLGRYEGTVIIVSHDRFFLNKMVNVVVELDGGGLTVYHGNYDTYEVRREENLERLRNEAVRQGKEIARVESFIDRFRYKASKAAQVQSRVKALEKVERVVVPGESAPNVAFRFPQPPRLGKIVLDIRGVSKTFGSNCVYENLNLEFLRGERVALVGPNGAGKTTLLKIIAGVLKPDAGEVILGSNVTVNYFAQHALESLNPANTILEEGNAAATPETAGMVRDMLGAFGFSGNEVTKKISVLSGGEKSRVAMARLLLNPAGVLLLDEPTNHLDMRTRETLEFALNQFEGVVVMVSHDRHFINEVATRTVHLEDSKATSYPGNYDYYRWKRDEELEPSSGEVEASTSNKKDIKRLAAELRQRKSDELRHLKPRLQQLEEGVMRLEEALGKLRELMSDPELYQDSDRAQRVAADFRTTEAELEMAMEEWGEVGAKVDEIEARYRAEEAELQR